MSLHTCYPCARSVHLLETAKANGVDGYRYLVALFTALPHAKTADDYEALLPWRLALPAEA